MKKMMLAAAMIFSLSTAFAFTGEEAVSKQALASFKTEYATAKDAIWTVGKNYYKVAFAMNDQQLFAYYSLQGEFIAISRYISSFQLPLYLQSTLKKEYSNYWISDLFETADSNGTGYFLTLENADTKIVLKSTGGNNWNVYKKIKKA